MNAQTPVSFFGGFPVLEFFHDGMVGKDVFPVYHKTEKVDFGYVEQAFVGGYRQVVIRQAT